MLLFKKKFLNSIRSGEKTQTIRLWKYCRLKAGQRSYIPGAGYIRIAAIEIVGLPDLTESDALRDGFASLAELLAEIDRLYPEGLTDGVRVYRITFAVLPSEEQVQKKSAVSSQQSAISNPKP